MQTKAVNANTVVQYWKRYEFTAGTYQITIPQETTVNFILVGGGGGGTAIHFTYWNDNHWGGCGGVCGGKLTVSAGTYTITVGGGGAGTVGIPDSGQTSYGGGGGTTSAFGQTANGGNGGVANANYGNYGWDGAGGGYSTTSSSVVGYNGGTSGARGYVYNNVNYGYGGSPQVSGNGGFARIDVLSNSSDYSFIRRFPIL